MRIILIFFLFILEHQTVFAQQFSIEIKDNNGIMHQENVYLFDQDSIHITSRSDYGRSVVNYLSRPLTKKEFKIVAKFIRSFPADSLVNEYFNEYTNFKFIDAEHSPRVIEIKIFKDGMIYNSKATNSYVRLYARLFENLNKVIPSEVNIKFETANFNAFY